MTTSDELPPELSMWTIYERPLDYPHSFVARRWTLNGPTKDIIIGHTLIEVHAYLPPGLYRIGRHPSDDPVIVETWI